MRIWLFSAVISALLTEQAVKNIKQSIKIIIADVFTGFLKFITSLKVNYKTINCFCKDKFIICINYFSDRQYP